MSASRRAFVIMPFGKKRLSDGTAVDCDDIYKRLLEPAIADAGLVAHRADADRRGGSIHLDMFQDLLLSEFVVADLTFDNPNVWYEIGVRHALRSGGTVMTYAARDRLPFEIAGQRTHCYTLKSGKLDPDRLGHERPALTEAIVATLGAWRGRRASPVYQTIPSLREPDWKTLKVGDVNEYWEALDTWRRRIDIARRNQRPGDILVLAEETSNNLLEFEALRTAADVLLRMNRPHYALTILEQARKLDPDDIRAVQIEAMALASDQRFAEAREILSDLLARHKDCETLSLYARAWKDEWTQVWNIHRLRETDPLAAARETAPILQKAAAAYYEAFISEPGEYHSGINVLTLGRLWEHVTGQESTLPLARIAAGVGWTASVAVERDKDYWSLATRAEMALLEGSPKEALADYANAAALAVINRDGYALESSGQQLNFLGALNFQAEIVGDAAQTIQRAQRQLEALFGDGRPIQSEPQRVVMFHGHMIDDPEVRGPGKGKPARFPREKIEAVASVIRQRLDMIGAATGDLGICGGNCGGDLLFAEACLERGMRMELRLARREEEFLAESVTFADPDRRWQDSFEQVRNNKATTTLVMPEELGPAPAGVSVHDRCNRWILYSALSMGLRKTFFVALWNGEPGDGPGGTQHMVELFRKVTGRRPEIIDMRRPIVR